MFRSADSESLSLRSVAFKIQLNQDVWSSPSNIPLLQALKQYLVFSEKARKQVKAR